jgi:hypothetical protein
MLNSLKKVISHIGTLTLAAVIAIGSVTYAYTERLNEVASILQQQSYELAVRTAAVRANFFKSKSQQAIQFAQTKEEELKQKDQELEARKVELDKATKELTEKLKELKSAKSQLSSNAAELSKLRNRPPLFTFNVESSSIANIDQKKQDIQQVVTDAYSVIEEVYGLPYLLHSVTISFVESFSNPQAAAEIVITNGSDGLSLTIKIKDFDKNDFNDVNGIIHEIIHSFHGIAVLDTVAYEEGITVAATDAVMERLISQGKIPAFKPLYIRISAATYANSPSMPSDTNAFYTSDNTGDYYQVAGYGWYQLYKANSNFFKTFNEKVYTEKRSGKDLSPEVVKTAIRESGTGSVQGKSINDWLETKAFALK